jgi:hypothetical protein
MSNIEDFGDKTGAYCWVKNSDMHPMQNIAGRMFRGKDRGGKDVCGIYGQHEPSWSEIEMGTLEWRFDID